MRLLYSVAGKVGWMTILVWSCYPIVWLFSEGFASFSVSFEITMYAILDVINKVIANFYPKFRTSLLWPWRHNISRIMTIEVL